MSITSENPDIFRGVASRVEAALGGPPEEGFPVTPWPAYRYLDASFISIFSL